MDMACCFLCVINEIKRLHFVAAARLTMRSNTTSGIPLLYIGRNALNNLSLLLQTYHQDVARGSRGLRRWFPKGFMRHGHVLLESRTTHDGAIESETCACVCVCVSEIIENGTGCRTMSHCCCSW